MRSKAAGLRKADRIQPELRQLVTVLDMNMRRLRTLKAVEEEAKARDSKDGWHQSISIRKIRACRLRFNGFKRALEAASAPDVRRDQTAA
jgi:hypothetical protein